MTGNVYAEGGGWGHVRVSLASDPRVSEHVFQWDALVGVVGEALANQVLALGRHSSVKVGRRTAYLLVILKGDVTADHVVKENA